MRPQLEHVQQGEALTLRSPLRAVEFAHIDNRAGLGHGHGDAGAHAPLTGSRTPYSYYFAPRPQQAQRRAAVPSSPREARAEPVRLKKRRTMPEEARPRPPKELIARPSTFVEESKEQPLHRPLSKSASSSTTAFGSTTSVLLPNLHGNSIWLNRRTQSTSKPSTPRSDLTIMRHSSASESSSATLIQPPTPSLLPPSPPPPPPARRAASPTPSTSTSLHYRNQGTMNPKRARPRPVSVATTMSLYSQMSYPHSLQVPVRPARAQQFKDRPVVRDENSDQQSIQTIATTGRDAVERRPALLTIANQRSIASVSTATTQQVVAPKPKASRGQGQRQRPRQQGSLRSVSGSDTSTLPGWAEHITEVQEEMKSFLDMSTDETHSSQWWSSEPATPTTLVHSPPATATSQRLRRSRCDNDRDSGILPRSLRSGSPSPAPTLSYIVLEREERQQPQQELPPPSAALAAVSTASTKRKTEIDYKPGYPSRPSFATSVSRGTFDSNGICADYDYSFAVDVLVYSNGQSAQGTSSSSTPIAGKSPDSLRMRTEEFGSIRRRASKKSSTKSSKRKMRLRRKWTLGISGSGNSRAKSTASSTKNHGSNAGSFRADGKEKRSLFVQVANFFGRA